ncbi:hypothetical protein IE81DRAFT_250688 [Ceraceosorus guamensis]|uniref:Uncharacterized protein n=1 Tax=Ceraceosorus guamensis TaxID=1522189 RepID=A0A316W6C1_9BASI|nr:hypothetical protein IE81DRAFT_250688 [Ceraceosorus guamensis]PWN44648.1 hypothetical protein IE81DRAFT_250688 [Ceraceosorus guamensis]
MGRLRVSTWAGSDVHAQTRHLSQRRSSLALHHHPLHLHLLTWQHPLASLGARHRCSTSLAPSASALAVCRDLTRSRTAKSGPSSHA